MNDGEETLTLRELLEQRADQFSFSCREQGQHEEVYSTPYGNTQTTWQRDWQVMVEYQGRQMQTEYHTGMARERPTLYDVLLSWLSDSDVLLYEGDFGMWADDLGYGIPDRPQYPGWMKKVWGIWRACQQKAADLQTLLGEDFPLFFPVRE